MRKGNDEPVRGVTTAADHERGSRRPAVVLAALNRARQRALEVAMEEDTFHAQRQEYLAAVTRWAASARATLGPVLATHHQRVMFRPTSCGITMVSLLPGNSQCGHGGYLALSRLASDFEAQFKRHCATQTPKRPTPEKQLQSYVIRDAQAHGGYLEKLNEAARRTHVPARLRFVADELRLATSRGECGFDLLAIEEQPPATRMVVIELKSARQMKRLVEQVTTNAGLVDAHRPEFERLCSAVLGRAVELNAPCGRWMVWPAAARRAARRPREAARQGIRVVDYVANGAEYEFAIMDSPS